MTEDKWLAAFRDRIIVSSYDNTMARWAKRDEAEWAPGIFSPEKATSQAEVTFDDIINLRDAILRRHYD